MKAYISLHDRNRTLLLSICLLALGLYMPPTAAHAFTCGPHMLTYSVYGSDGILASGVRCVKVSSYSPGGSSAGFDWYGEGDWGGGPYRHIGAGYTSQGEFGSLATAADMYGNGETFNGFSRNLVPEVTVGNWPAPQEVRLTGDWDEIWRLVKEANYTPLPLPTVCGPHFTSYNVTELAAIRQGSGVRCVLDLGGDFYLWFGTGEWGGFRYTHIGHFNIRPGDDPGTGQAVDLCDPKLSTACNDFPAASLTFRAMTYGYQVGGAWSERWNPTIPKPLYFNVMTANLWGGASGDRGLDRIACAISNTDIVFLQEVDQGTKRSGGVDQPNELAQKSGLLFRASGVSRPGFDGGDYVDNVILSRYPLSELTVHKVTAPGWDYHQESLIIHAVVTFYHQRINLLATHYPAGDVNRAPEARQKATEFVRGLIDNLQDPIIYGGDLNATMDRLEIMRLTDKLTDSWNAAPAGSKHISDTRIDYLLFKGPYVVRAYETDIASFEKPGCSLVGADLSDHPFVLVRFEIVN